MYNPYVLTRPYRHLTFVASIVLHRIPHMSSTIILAIRLWDLETIQAYRMNIPTSRQKQTHHPSTKVSWLFNELSVANSSLSTSRCSATSCDVTLLSSILLQECLKRTIWSLYHLSLFKFFTLFAASSDSYARLRCHRCHRFHAHWSTILLRKSFNLNVLNRLIFERAYES